MNIDLTKRWLAHFEARRAVAYDDHNGRPLLPGIQPIGCPTIGIGCNLLTASARTEIKTLGLDYSRVVSGMLELNDDQIDHLLNIDLDQAIRTARLLVPSLDHAPDPQALVLVDLAFNMGESRLRGFVHVLNYCRVGKWTMAASELRNSRWFGQVGRRGVADVAVLGGTVDPEAILSA